MLQPQLSRFNRKNFNQWSIQMKVLYGSQELWDIVERGYTDVENQGVLTNQKLLLLQRRLEIFYDLPIKEKISLRSNGEEVGDQRVVERILRSMPRKFEHIVVEIEESKDLSTLSINSLMGSLQSHELRLKQFDVNPEEAFQMQTLFRGGSRGRRGGHGRRGGRGSRRGRGFGRNQGGGRGNFSQIQCFNCRKYGHFQADCWALKNGVGNTTMNMHKEQKKNDEGILFLACSVQDNVLEPTWYLDSGCSNHMTGNRSIFVTLDESFQSEVKTGDNTILQVKGQCDILVKTKKGTKRVTNVFYVPGLKHNLLSIGQLLQRGLKVSFEGDICAIKDQPSVLIAKIKTLRSDRGGEYIAFGNFFKEQGIHHQMTARMTPQQNGVLQRKNRTIMKMARSMLKAKNLPNEFWGDVVACTVYILNRAPTKNVPGMTPYEAWCGEKPYVSHLRVFGSIAYSNIQNQLRGKLDDKSEKCIMVGYNENSKAYRLYNPVSRKIIISRDVIFSEDESWNWSDDVDEAKIPFHVNIDENKVAQELEQAEIQAVESSSSSTPSSTSDNEISPRRMRSIQEIYNTTNRINDDHFANFALFAGVDPVTFDEAIQDEKWKIAMDQEIDAIRRNETWELMELMTNKQAFGVKWVYRTKLKSDGFRRCPYEHALYVKEDKYDKFLIVSLYVDDLLFTGNDKFLCDDFKNSMKKEFEMSDMGLIHYFLDIEVNQDEGEIVISQQKYAHDLLKKIRMENASPCNTLMDANLKLCKNDIGEAVDPSLYRSLVGSLMYLTATRPDILFVVSMLSRFMTNPKRSHWEAGKRVLRYILGTINFGIYYNKVSESVLFGFCDSDWGGNVDDHKSKSGYVFSIGSGVFPWTSKKQSVVALSTTEAEYISLVAAGCQALWLRWMLKELKCTKKCETVLFYDNESAIALSKNTVFHGRSKHIRIKYHFIRELVKDGEVIVKYCKTQDRVADIFTKALKFDLFVKFRGKLGVAQV
ncbi:integrase [Cucumis melo var. makuwa]|uniref:Integrase n=1 Tax=Cucumis melo var. makuwa TaxID=1194695 RepID=A0A5A7TCS4_CUCMM|nr:integrase [Cucumis melo var. makuwa]